MVCQKGMTHHTNQPHPPSSHRPVPVVVGAVLVAGPQRAGGHGQHEAHCLRRLPDARAEPGQALGAVGQGEGRGVQRRQHLAVQHGVVCGGPAEAGSGLGPQALRQLQHLQAVLDPQQQLSDMCACMGGVRRVFSQRGGKSAKAFFVRCAYVRTRTYP